MHGLLFWFHPRNEICVLQTSTPYAENMDELIARTIKL